MVQGAKHMKSSNAADNGGSSPQPKPQPKPKRRRKRLPRWADRLITIVIILIGVGLMTWPWILDRLEASGVFNQISTVSSTVDALSAEERERILLQARSFNEQLAGEATELPADQIEELRELSYMGASVLHEEAVFPVREAGIPLVIKNTNAPQDPGTIISETADEGEAEPIITGVTGKRGFVAINVARDRTKPRVGFMRRALSVFERYDVSVEHMPTGVDRFGAVVQEQDVHDSLYSLVGDIQQEVEPLEIEVVEGLALIATVGRNLRGRAGISGHLFGMLGQAGVSVRMISQSCDEINIIIGVEEKDFDLAIQTIYRAFSDENGIVKVSDLEVPAPVDPALAALRK